jgi:transposase
LAHRLQVHHHGTSVVQLSAHIDMLDESIADLDERIAERMRGIQPIIGLVCTIPGVARETAENDNRRVRYRYSQSPSAAHPASWAAICLVRNESEGKRRSGATHPGPEWLRRPLTESERASWTKNTYLAARFARIRSRRGKAKAHGAIRRGILIAYYHYVRDKILFKELGGDWFARLDSPEHKS